MKRLFFISLLFLVGVLVHTGCKKYDEGPVLSLRTAKDRLVKEWKLELSIGRMDCSFIYINRVEFFKDNTFVYRLGDKDRYTGIWEFEERKKVIVLTFDFDYIVKWRIIKLTKYQLWVANQCTLSNGDKFEPEYRFNAMN